MSDLRYCPWCYDGVRNYDETDVDCGGSCGSCESGLLYSIPQKETKLIYGLLLRAVLLFVVLFYHYSNRRKVIWA